MTLILLSFVSSFRHETLGVQETGKRLYDRSVGRGVGPHLK